MSHIVEHSASANCNCRTKSAKSANHIVSSRQWKQESPAVWPQEAYCLRHIQGYPVSCPRGTPSPVLGVYRLSCHRVPTGFRADWGTPLATNLTGVPQERTWDQRPDGTPFLEKAKYQGPGITPPPPTVDTDTCEIIIPRRTLCAGGKYFLVLNVAITNAPTNPSACRLTMRVWLECSDDYYDCEESTGGARCDKFCHVDQTHGFCDQHGNPVCNQGNWPIYVYTNQSSCSVCDKHNNQSSHQQTWLVSLFDRVCQLLNNLNVANLNLQFPAARGLHSLKHWNSSATGWTGNGCSEQVTTTLSTTTTTPTTTTTGSISVTTHPDGTVGNFLCNFFLFFTARSTKGR